MRQVVRWPRTTAAASVSSRTIPPMTSVGETPVNGAAAATVSVDVAMSAPSAGAGASVASRAGATTSTASTMSQRIRLVQRNPMSNVSARNQD